MSSAKVEKVVKPPQKPVMSNALIDDDNTPRLSAKPNSRPIKKLPTTFTANVPRGKPPKWMWSHRRPVRNRRQVPAKPPHPAINISFIIAIKRLKKVLLGGRNNYALSATAWQEFCTIQYPGALAPQQITCEGLTLNKQQGKNTNNKGRLYKLGRGDFEFYFESDTSLSREGAMRGHCNRAKMR